MGFKITEEYSKVKPVALPDLEPGLYVCTTTGSNDVFAIVKGPIKYHKGSNEYKNVILLDKYAAGTSVYYSPSNAWAGDLFAPVESIKIEYQ